MSDASPCACWTRTPALPHSGHCCFGYREDDAYEYGKAPPCGHWDERVPRPPKLTEDQAHAWARRRCIECLTAPASAGRYVCNECWATREGRTA